jgi:tetratricopeptide (TPR) repeat protein
MTVNRIQIVFRLLFCTAFLFMVRPGYGLAIPEWFIVFRDKVYRQTTFFEQLVPIYNETKARAVRQPSAVERYALLSACESLMGQAYLYGNRYSEALSCFSSGAEYAQKSLDAVPTAEGYMLLSANLILPCLIRPFSAVWMQALQAERAAKKAINLDTRNVIALYLLATRYVYAKPGYTDYRRGIQMLEEIVKNNEPLMREDEQFNVYSALAYAYIHMENIPAACPWLQKASQVYPSNPFIHDLNVMIQQNSRGVLF